MSFLDRVTPLILTFDEEPNIGRTLKRLHWARRIVVVDSYSHDGTTEIVERFPGAILFQRRFDTHFQQWNYGLDQVKTEWVLALDADYIVPPHLTQEIAHLPDDPIENGFYASFKYAVFGQLLRASLYPPREVLFRRSHAVFEDDGHTQRVRVSGRSGRLNGSLIHDDRKPISRWIRNQVLYADKEAEKLIISLDSDLNFIDRFRKTAILAPPAVAIYCLFVKRLVLEGWPGWYYTLQRTIAEVVLAMRLIERRTALRSREEKRTASAKEAP